MTSDKDEVTRDCLRENLQELLTGQSDLAFFYFAGHGTENNLGGYLVTQDASRYDLGVPMTDVLSLANKSGAREVVVVLDCCHSGALGQIPAIDNTTVMLREGLSVLSACRSNESAEEKNGGGVFTSLVGDALAGGAADVCGKVTVAGVYAYVDEALGAWDQRPLFKSHVSKLVALRQCEPTVPLEVLRLLPGYFKGPYEDYRLDSSYEPQAEPPHPEHEAIFANLQRCYRAGLVTPVDAEHIYYAAINEKACKLTALGRYYWRLANSGKL
jgi:hypothetical protein